MPNRNRARRGRGGGPSGRTADSAPVAQMQDLSIGASSGRRKGQPMSSTLPPKCPGGTKGEQVLLDTNMWPIVFPANSIPLYRYEVSVKAVAPRGRPREMAGGGKNDYLYVQRREVCCYVFFELFNQNGDKLGNYFDYQYDMARIVYTCNNLDGKLQNPYIVKLTVDSLNELGISNDIMHFEVRLTPVSDKFSLTLGDFQAAINPDLKNRDRSAVQHMEMTTNQVIHHNLNHCSYNNSHYHKQEAVDPDALIGDDREMIRGFVKNVRAVGTDKQMLVMMVDTKTDVWWKEQLVLALAEINLSMDLDGRFNARFEEWQREKLSLLLRNLALETTYIRRAAPVEASGLSQLRYGGAYKVTAFETDQGPKSVAQYMKERYEEEVCYPNLPLVKEFRQRDKSYNHYALEFCYVLPGQRIEQSKQTPMQMSAVVPKSALKPEQRWYEIDRLARQARLFENQHLSQLNLAFAKRLVVNGRVLKPPVIQYMVEGKLRDVYMDPVRSVWTMPGDAKFVICGNIRKWAVLVVKNYDGSFPDPDKDHQQKINNFIQSYIDEATSKGMTVPWPYFIHSMMPEEAEKVGDHCHSEGVMFVLLITQRKDNEPLHAAVKEYYEERLGILTECLVYDKTINAKKNIFTNILQNIVYKTNTKVGGLCYDIRCPDIMKNGMMILSYDVCHPTNLKPGMLNQDIPSTVGFCTNSGRHHLQLTGNYGYQAMRKEECGTILKHLMLDQLEIWLKNHQEPPKYLLVLRDGVSEGQYLKVIEQELPMLQAAFTEKGYEPPPIEAYTTEKRHSARFRQQATQGPHLNVRPGTVIEMGASTNEFYFGPHKAIQGTACLPRYTQLVSEIGLTMDEIQEIIYILACNHQIITAPISLPATLYAADELAKRGRNSRRARIGRDESSSAQSADSGLQSAQGDTEAEGNFQLGITGPLRYVKFWA